MLFSRYSPPPLCSKILLWIIITIIVIIQYIPVSQWHRSFCVSPLFYFSCYFFHAESVASVQIRSWSSFVRAKSSQQVMLWRRPSQTWQIINKTKKVKKKRVTKTETKKTGRGGIKKKSVARRICVVNTALPLFLEVQFTFWITKLGCRTEYAHYIPWCNILSNLEPCHTIPGIY